MVCGDKGRDYFSKFEYNEEVKYMVEKKKK
jgi:hypothetical protein